MLSRFELHEPQSVQEAASLLARYGQDARLLAGGTELVPLLKGGLLDCRHLVNLKAVPGLDRLDLDTQGDVLRIGPLVTHRTLERSPLVKQRFPLLAEVEHHVANVRVRNVGTLGGNLCFAEPHADPGTLLLAFGARVVIGNALRQRLLPVDDFFVDYYQTVLEEDEVLTEVQVPLMVSSGAAYLRFCSGERPSVGIAVRLTLADGGRAVESAVLAVGCVGPKPFRAWEAEAALKGMAIEEALASVEHAGRLAAEACDPIADLTGSAEYKRALVAVLVERGIKEAYARYRPGEEKVQASLHEQTSTPPAAAPISVTGNQATQEGGIQLITLSCRVNGIPRSVSVPPHVTLLELVRDHLGLTGTKRACEMEVCGVCTILLDGRAVSACATLAFEARGKDLVTIEGLAREGRLDPVQEAFVTHGGFQCGFCTPGMILAAKVLLQERPSPTEEEIREHLDGNICRCTGYQLIIEAVQAAAQGS